ncbi:hypothetical protein EVAR_57960_1 [Eumeta japonica]|uniref:Uncharacterized protein n=1 Tax=Eumeta variegata TaxID=151549 RepID=A0A4C1XWR6_EUMVA|nr:hypothetical protein EVAR_57960_1 [Eumeta japonica]
MDVTIFVVKEQIRGSAVDCMLHVTACCRWCAGAYRMRASIYKRSGISAYARMFRSEGRPPSNGRNLGANRLRS